mgnify:CR=1 FL=1
MFTGGFTLELAGGETIEADTVVLAIGVQGNIRKLGAPGEERLGGHAVMLVGYEDMDSRFIVRNSWGMKWGADGHFTMPYAYITNPDLADDLWVIRSIS